MNAALAFCDYCRESARYIFGDAEPFPDDKIILDALREKEMTRTEISELFSRHRTHQQITAALSRLSSRGLIKESKKTGKGAPTTTYKILKRKGAK